jgi:Tfp pilus assembly protein PilV
MNRGIILIETALTVLILSLGVLALAPLLAYSVRASGRVDQVKVATQLSTELLEEILMHKWDTLTPATGVSIARGSTTLGVDAGETAGIKTTFDDIDDFNGYGESPPRDPLMQSLTVFNGYTRTVSVSYVTAALVASGMPTDYKQVQVCTQWKAQPAVCLNTLVTNR